MRVLAGDVGGTNARLALADVDGARVALVAERRYSSREFPGLAPIVLQFCADVKEKPDRACFGIACPITGENCRASNLPWTIRRADLAAAIGVRSTRIVNDFDAIGYGLASLGAADLVALQAGERVANGPIALIGPGTGLGQGALLWDGAAYHVHASEGGHADFAARTPLEAELAAWLWSRFGRASWERVLSGPGLLNVYGFLTSSGHVPEQPAVRAEMERGDGAAVLTRHALAGSDAACVQALDIFAACLGAYAGNVALSVLATGGVYVAGGIAPRVVEWLGRGGFAAAFRDKGRLGTVVARMPVAVVMNPDVGLLGAAAAAAAQP